MQFPLYLAMFAAIGAVIVAGAGCGPSDTSVAVPATGANGDSVLSYANRVQPIQPVPEPTPAPAPSGDAVAASEGNGSASAQADARPAHPGILGPDRIFNKQVRMQTSKGEIVFELFGQEAPKTVSNFVALAEKGFYDGLTFHRVVPGFVIQGGDPEGTGMGGPGYKFEDEPVTRDYEAGIVAMANAGPNTNGSQFFIVLEDQPTLPKAYTIFGKVTKGMDVVRKIAKDDTMDAVRVEAKQ